MLDSDSEIVQKIVFWMFIFYFPLPLPLLYLPPHPPLPPMTGFVRILKYFDFDYVEIILCWINLESEFNIMQILNLFPIANEMLNIPSMRWKILQSNEKEAMAMSDA